MDSIYQIREILGLNDKMFSKIPDDLILLAFIPKNAESKYIKNVNEGGIIENIYINKNEVDRIYENHGHKDYELFEFFGDAILESIVSMVIFEKYIINRHKKIDEGALSRYRSSLLKNSTLFCHMNRKKMCVNIRQTHKQQTAKTCADVLEAIIGIVFYYFYYVLKLDNSLDIVKDWYIKNFYVDESIRFLDEKNEQYITSCNMQKDLLKNCKCKPNEPLFPELSTKSQKSQKSQKSSPKLFPELSTKSQKSQKSPPKYSPKLLPKLFPNLPNSPKVSNPKSRRLITPGIKTKKDTRLNVRKTPLYMTQRQNDTPINVRGPGGISRF